MRNISYYVHLQDEDRSEERIQALRRLSGTEQVNLLFDEESY